MTLPWRLKYWNGTGWVNSELRKWNGSSWVLADAYYWDGSQWVIITDRTPPTQNYTGDFGSIWSASYQGSNAKRTDSETTTNQKRFQGYFDSFWGDQRSMWGLDYTFLRAWTAPATNVHYANIYMNNNHLYYTSGTAVLGTHVAGGEPGSFQYNRFSTNRLFVNRGEERWWDIGSIFGWWAREGSFNGFTLFDNTTDTGQYYGYWQNYVVFRVNLDK